VTTGSRCAARDASNPVMSVLAADLRRLSDRRILILDIETTPNLAAVYDLRTTYVSPKNITEQSRPGWGAWPGMRRRGTGCAATTLGTWN